MANDCISPLLKAFTPTLEEEDEEHEEKIFTDSEGAISPSSRTLGNDTKGSFKLEKLPKFESAETYKNYIQINGLNELISSDSRSMSFKEAFLN